jgi:hypothetical protein
MPLKPFADDASVVEIDALTIENGTAGVTIHGSLNITRDGRGLDAARTLAATLTAIIAALESTPDLPPTIAVVSLPTDDIANPFGSSQSPTGIGTE